VRRAAIFCSEGGLTGAAIHELIAQRDPRAAVFADGDWELHELATGHWSMFADPGGLARLLDEVAMG
jgi:hypothetical protein